MSEPTELRDRIRDEVSGIQIGTGYYAQTIGIDGGREVADAILPLVEEAANERDEIESRLANLLCELTDGRMSGTGYDVPTMVSEVEAAFERDAAEAVAAERERLLSEPAVEAAAEAQFEIGFGDYTWAEMVVEDPSRADIWREDARAVLEAAVAAAIRTTKKEES